MAYHVQGEMETDFFEENVEQVMDRIEGLEDVEVDFIVIENTEHCERVFDYVSIEDREAFLQNCENALTSVSYRAQGQEIIVVKADKAFIRENGKALRGLLAHELMHVIHRRSGVEEEIQDASKEYAEQMVEELRNRNLTDEEISGFIGTVFATAIFCLKDIYANTDLIEQSFTAELEEYYYHMLGLEGYCRVPEFYQEEVSLEEVENAIAFELGLLPAWLPFKALDRDASNDIRERIRECYERDIPEVAAHLHQLADLYREEYDDPDVFKDEFFDHVLSSAYHLIETKRGQPA